MKKYFIHLFVIIISSIFLGVACVLLIKAHFGCDAMTTYYEGMQKTFHCPLSIANLTLNGTMAVIVCLFNYRQLGIGTIVCLIVGAYTMDIASLYIGTFTGIYRILAFCLGLILMSLSIALASKTDIGKNPYDALCFSISNKINKKYNIIRFSIDSILLVIGLLLGGTLNIGTVISILCVGNLAEVFMKLIKFNKEINYEESN